MDGRDGRDGEHAQLMREYIEELETLWDKSNAFITWGSRPTAITYATIEKLLQWEKNYDKMLDLTKESPEYSKNISIARIGLDSFLVSKLAGKSFLTKGNFEDPGSSAGSVVKTLLDNSTGVVVEKDKGIPCGYYDRQGKIFAMPGKIEFKDIAAGKYKLYYLGRTTISNDSIIWIGSWYHPYSIGRFSQVGNEKLKYDISAMLKFSGPSFGSTDSDDKDAVHKDQLFIVEVNE